MTILNELKPNQVFIDDVSQSKTAVLTHVSEIFAGQMAGLDAKSLFRAYWERENLGSTGLGNGVAIPHIRHPQVAKPHLCFLRLMHPVDFAAEDNQPVDMVFALLMPEHEPQLHLKILSELAQQINAKDFCKNCRQAKTVEALYRIVHGS